MMEENGENGDDQGSGWLQVKKVSFLTLLYVLSQSLIMLDESLCKLNGYELQVRLSFMFPSLSLAFLLYPLLYKYKY